MPSRERISCRPLELAQRILFLTAWMSLAPVGAMGQASSGEPWLGLRPPPGLEDVRPVNIGTRANPARIPPGEEGYRDLQGERIRSDLEAIVGFSRQSRESGELGGSQLWGRVSGFPSGTQTVRWAAEQLRIAGVPQVEVQTFSQSPDATLVLPVSWEVRLMGDPAFGPGNEDVILESAMPIGLMDLPDGQLEAPLIYVGTGNPAVLAHLDVRGKVAVQQVIPQGHTVFERGIATPGGQELIERGAAAVINIVKLPGNERGRDLGCGGLCFNVGGRDGHFLESLFAEAARAGVLDQLRVRLGLRTAEHSGLQAENAVAVIPGASDEVIVVNAHADAWFEGAGDNGDGLAVMLALARHFARPENQPQRTLVFVVSAGHHSTGLSGPTNFVRMNPEIGARAVLAINVEHVAQRNITVARPQADDGYREWVADSGEAPIVAGVTNDAPFVHELLDQGVERYGINLVSERSTACSGECGGFAPLGVARLHLIQGPPLYHTSGERIEMISTPGLERMARFLAFFLDEAARAPRDLLNPATE